MSQRGERAAGDRTEPVRILFVCLGNICRSPTAEAVFAAKVRDAGLHEVVEVDSAGTGGWHVGDLPDARARAEASSRGIDLTSRARQVHVGDFELFDLVVAMDAGNHADLTDLALHDEHRAKIRLLREFDEAAVAAGDLDVPDPYYGGDDGFARVFDLVDRACEGLLAHVVEHHLDRR